MSKQAREQRRHIARLRRSSGGEVADRADAALAGLLEGIKAYGAARGQALGRIDPTAVGTAFRAVRQHFLDAGYRWPSWSYLPLGFIAATSPIQPGAVDPPGSLTSTTLAGLAAAWLPGRIAVRYDPDVATALTATTFDESVPIPVEALRRLPAWGVYIDWPALGENAGVFVALDPGEIERPTAPTFVSNDELMVAIVRDTDPRLLVTTLWLPPGASITEALAAQARQESEVGRSFGTVTAQQWAAAVGMTRAELFSQLLPLVLYLCSDEPDTTTTAIPPLPRRGSPIGSGQAVKVVSAGYRIGAALRRHSPGSHPGAGTATGRRVAPHLRKAHWHHYWYGSHQRGDRHLRLRWIPPIPVNADDGEQLLTVVRSA